MKLLDDHIRFSLTIFESTDAFRYFIAEIKQKYPDFFAELGKSCDEFVAHWDLRENDVRGRRRVSHAFLAYACGKLAALYAANGKKIPRDIVDIFCDFKTRYASQEYFQECFDRFCMINREWTEYFVICAQEEGFCWHGLGPVYAWADAFLAAQKLDEKRAAESADTVKRTAGLLDEWLPDNIDLPEEGEKNIGE